jgi:hypothetical protein
MSDATTFAPAPASSFAPQSVSFYSEPRNPMDQLPASAQNRLRTLRQRIQDKHSLIPESQLRREVHTEKLESKNRLARLQGHRSTGGFEQPDDAPQVVAEKKKYDALVAEADRLDGLDALRSREWAEAGYALRAIETFLRDGVPGGCRLDVCETAAPALAKGQTLADAIATREKRIAELQVEARKVEALPLPAAHARKRLRDKVTALAAAGKPDVSQLLIATEGEIQFAEKHTSVPVIGKAEANLASWQQPDSFLLTCYLNREALLNDLDAEITALSAKSNANAMAPEEKEKALAVIASNVLAVDRELCELIWRAQEENLPYEFRSTANPLAVLGLQLVTVASLPAPPTTSRYGYDIVRPH